MSNTEHIDCVFNRGDRCSALHTPICKVGKCSFYKSKDNFYLDKDRYAKRRKINET